MNVSFGYILSNNETGEYRYYYSSDNTTVLPKPKLVEHFEQFKLLKQDIFSTDFIEKFTNKRQRLSTCHSLITPTNGKHRSRCNRYFGFHQILDECVDTYLQQIHKIKLNDNLCVFRALSVFQENSKHGLESRTMELFQLYIRGVQKILPVLSCRTCQTLKSFVLAPSECF